MPNNLIKQLEQISLFAELSRDDLKAVAKLVNSRPYLAGSEVCHQGELGLTAYFVESGELSVLYIDPQGLESEVARLGPGDYFGETSLLLGEPRDATIKVVQDANLLYLNKDEFDQLLHERPSVLETLQMRPDVAQKRRAKRFKWQNPDEIVIVRLHKHNAILIRNLVLPVFILLVELGGFGYWLMTKTAPSWAWVMAALLALPPLLFVLYVAIDHYNDDYVLTNKRVVHEERIPLIHEARAEAPLRSVQDIEQSQEGLLARIFNFSDLIIETAGERGQVVFRQIPNPAETRDAIFEQIRRVQSGARAEERVAIRDALRRHFGTAPPTVPSPASEEEPAKRRLKLALPSWVLAPLRIFRYFLPSLRYEQGDTITWRKHWIVLLKSIALPTLLTAVVTLIVAYVLFRNPANWASPLIGYGVALVFLFPWWLWVFDDWQNDIYQVTATRIIDVERGLFHLREERREASLGMIQNITLEISGFLAKLFKYGSVTIETAGAGAFTFEHVKDPHGVQVEIFRRVEAFQRRQRLAAAERHRAELLDWFAVYNQIHNLTDHAVGSPSVHQRET
ncbi:MAG: cyclic nucleotide-binding domain-containing protein [Chloroflexota bacterium]|nr:cyclic nucleotide-binding domain-containing protein [Chloroflexota bacterium]